MVKVLVGSRNPVKTSAVAEAFGHYYPEVDVQAVEVASGVPAQPAGDDTFAGAANRARALAALNAAAEYCVELEGGMIRLAGTWFAFGVVCVLDRQGQMGQATSGLFELPPGLVPEMLAGVELGSLIDGLAGEQNSKQRGGAAGYLSRGAVDRRSLYVQALLLALIPFHHPDLYPAWRNVNS